jgi:L-iditol 2-dehydrogenase
MKALVKYKSGRGNVELREVEDPRCGGEQVKIEVSYCGVCGTDLHVYEDTFKNYPPVILGHEFSGRVVELGENVRHVALGDAVTVLPASAVVCGSCAFCRTGYFMFCSRRRGMGHGINGAFAKYAVVRKDQAYKVPPDLTLEEAALSEPFAAAVQAVTEVTNVRLGDVVLISGPGPIGLLCLKLLVAEGIKTIVAGTSEDKLRLETARRLGAKTTVDTGRDELTTVIAEETHGLGVDVAFECAGAAQSARNCLRALKPLGQYTQVGIFGKEISVEFDMIFYKQLRVAGSVAYSIRTWERLVKIFEQRAVRLDDLITHKMPLEKWRDAFDLCLNRQAIKVLLSPDD